MKNVAGIILAGGKNKRMGSVKAFITIGNKRIIDRILYIFRKMFSEIVIVTDKKSRFMEFENSKIKVVEDLVKEKGPLGGIYSGLQYMSGDTAFFVACDMLFLHIGLIKRLLKIAGKGNFDCVIPYSDKGFEPLHGIYSKKILPDLKMVLNGKKNLAVTKFLSRMNCKYVKTKKEEQISFFNINTPGDLKSIYLSKSVVGRKV